MLLCKRNHSACCVSTFPFRLHFFHNKAAESLVPSALWLQRNPQSLTGFPPNSTVFRQTQRQVKIGVYFFELGHRGHSIPSGGKLSGKLQANKVAAHKLINQQRQINSDKHRGHFCPFQCFMGEENNVVSNLRTLRDINITITNIRPLS